MTMTRYGMILLLAVAVLGRFAPAAPAGDDVAALEALLAADPPDGAAQVRAAIDDRRLEATRGVALVAAAAHPEATALLAAAMLESESPALRALLLAALVARGDRAAAPGAWGLLSSTDPGESAAAIRALARLGTPADARELLRVAARGRRDALDAVVAMEAPGTDLALAVALGLETDAAVRRRLAEALAARGDAAQADRVLGALADERDPAARQALARAAAALVATPESYRRLAMLAVAAELRAEEVERDRALAEAAPRIGADAASRAIRMAVDSDAALLTPRWIALLGRIGGEAAAEIVGEAALGAEDDAAAAALRALVAWPDEHAAAPLRAIVIAPRRPGDRESAFPGYVAALGRIARRDPASAVAALADAMDLARGAEERRQVLAAWSVVAHADAMEAIDRFLDEPSLAGRAAEAMLRCAEGLAPGALPGDRASMLLRRAADSRPADRAFRIRAGAAADALEPGVGVVSGWSIDGAARAGAEGVVTVTGPATLGCRIVLPEAATLRIDVAGPESAQVRVDGRAIARDDAGERRVAVEAGSHELVIVLDRAATLRGRLRDGDGFALRWERIDGDG